MITNNHGKLRTAANFLGLAHFASFSAALPPKATAALPARVVAKKQAAEASRPIPAQVHHTFDHLARCGDAIYLAMQNMTQPTTTKVRK